LEFASVQLETVQDAIFHLQSKLPAGISRMCSTPVVFTTPCNDMMQGFDLINA